VAIRVSRCAALRLGERRQRRPVIGAAGRLALVERERPAVVRQSVRAKRRKLDRGIDPVEQCSTETDS